jgi:hypothetical protein
MADALRRHFFFGCADFPAMKTNLPPGAMRGMMSPLTNAWQRGTTRNVVI